MGLISYMSSFWPQASLPEPIQHKNLNNSSVERVENNSGVLFDSAEWVQLCDLTKSRSLEPIDVQIHDGWEAIGSSPHQGVHEEWELIGVSPDKPVVRQRDGVEKSSVDEDFVAIEHITTDDVAIHPGLSGVSRDIRMHAYAAASDVVNTEMEKRLLASEHEKDPAAFLQFVANNTNPHMFRFAWSNLVIAVKECIAEMSLKPATRKGLRLNCVHCAKAADLTLHNAYKREGSAQEKAMLVEVKQGRPGLSNEEFYHVQLLQHRGDSNYLDDLKRVLKPGERACIIVPVTGAGSAYQHTMNMINLGPDEAGGEDRMFILCPQSGSVFNLHREADVIAFYARYTKDSALEAYDIKYAITSDKNEGTEQTIHALSAIPRRA